VASLPGAFSILSIILFLLVCLNVIGSFADSVPFWHPHIYQSPKDASLKGYAKEWLKIRPVCGELQAQPRTADPIFKDF
jgi:hypothetical protein